jgi:enterochelin esterase family protein
MSRAAARRRSYTVTATGTGGRRRRVAVPSRILHADVPVAIWSPPGTRSRDPLPLLVAHDGPDYADRTPLLEGAGHRVALLSAPDRNEWYSASAVYARALANEILPAIARAVAVAGRPVGVGASLGALSLLQAHRRHPDLLGGLFLQSGSFFVGRFDRHESHFARYDRIIRFVRTTLRAPDHPHTLPVVMTCGADEENLDNNRVMAHALRGQGYPLEFHVIPGGHSWESWAGGVRDHLPALLHACWA